MAKQSINPLEIFRPSVTTEVELTWLAEALEDLAPPTSLLERNMKQIVMADRFRVQFQKDKLTAYMTVATQFGKKFPH